MTYALVSHIDLDGCGAPILSKVFGIDYDEIFMVNYGFENTEEMDRIKRYDVIHFADISVSRAVYEDLLASGHTVFLFDHHDNVKELLGLPGIFFDLERSGTQIFYEEFVLKNFNTTPIIDRFVELVSTYDLWKDTSESWEEALSLNRVWSSYVNWQMIDDGFIAYEPFIDLYAMKLTRLVDWKWTSSEKMAIKKAKDKENWQYKESMKVIDIRKDSRGRTFGITSASSKVSIIASRILNNFPDMDYLIVASTFKGNPYNGNLSIRSKEFDCKSLFPFNGHHMASGASIETKFIEYIMRNHNVSFNYKEDLGLAQKGGEDYDPKQDEEYLKLLRDGSRMFFVGDQSV